MSEQEKPKRKRNKEAAKAYYEANKERFSAQRRERYLRNKEKELAQNKAWHDQNKERHYQLSNEWRKVNKERVAETRKVLYYENPEKHRKKGREKRKQNPDTFYWNRVLRDYGLTKDGYKALHDAQDGRCAICEKHCKTHKRLSVDHSHSTGAVRGLLCQRCNSAIGLLGENVETIAKAMNYLARAA